ncbi:MAG: helicase-exonuclease AddAB subunit AddA [Streptococcaceae bacterium]|nr:helicase-exonuclease AddAB subunit AddA [Streptococcaceae bacterium]
MVDTFRLQFDNPLTEAQERAVFSEGHNILVSASAGSGKTTVMANRIVQKIISGVSIESLFVSTFTNKAAGELHVRIERELKKAGFQAHKEKNQTVLLRIRHALQELSHAQIGTMDAFCQQFLRTHFELAGVASNFRILSDAAELTLLKKQTFETLIEEFLSVDGFSKTLKNFSPDRTLDNFFNSVDSIYTYCQSTENPEKWLEARFLSGFSTYDDVAKLPTNMTQGVKESLQELFDSFRLGVAESAFSKVVLEKVTLWLDNEDVLLQAFETRDFITFAEIFNDLQSDDTKLKKFTSKKSKELELDQIFEKNIGTKSKPGVLSAFNNRIKHAKLIADYQSQALELAKSLQQFCRAFYARFLVYKKEMNAYEFSDIQHFTISILEESANDTAQHLQASFSEILIDEYQDTSHVQERMLQLLSNGRNLFMVGDVKQSIYGFRLADSQLFQEKFDSYDEKFVDGVSSGELILLKENFRSRKEVIDFTNFVFSHLMDKSLGELDYDEKSELIKGNPTFPDVDDTDFLPEFLIYSADKTEPTADKDESEQPEALSDGEIRLAGQEILRLHQEKSVGYQEITLLVRSKTNNEKIQKTLESMGIPVVLDETPKNFLKSMEIQVMMDVLRAVDNPLFDKSLVALLRSPLFLFDEDELTQISLMGDTRVRFWEKIQAFLDDTSRQSSPLYSKLTEFRVMFTAWRELSILSPIHVLLQKIYEDSYYPEYVGALANGLQRQANLHALSTRAKRYEESGYKGVFQFIKLIETVLDQENDLTAVTVKLPGDAVRVMTIHHAKGLEFDYVFLMNLSTKFNTTDLSKPLILSRKNGIGLQHTVDLKKKMPADYFFPFANVKLDTLPYLVNREELRRARIAEEMRMLYVALTRAAKKVYLVGKTTTSDIFKSVEAIKLTGNILSDVARNKAKGYQYWILALQHVFSASSSLKISVSSQLAAISELSAENPRFDRLLEESKKFDGLMEMSDEIAQAKKIMSASYAHKRATETASVQSPSHIELRNQALFETTEILETQELPSRTLEMFDVLADSALKGTDLGTAVHALLERLDFSNPTETAILSALTELKLNEKSHHQLEKAFIPRIQELFETRFGTRLIRDTAITFKEMPFSFVRMDEIADEDVIIRGIIDGFIKYSDAETSATHLVLFDYKTNKFKTDADIARIRATYTAQMTVYAEALSRAYGEPIAEIEKVLILLGGPKVEIVIL